MAAWRLRRVKAKEKRKRNIKIGNIEGVAKSENGEIIGG
jgi:hypothetical protein